MQLTVFQSNYDLQTNWDWSAAESDDKSRKKSLSFGNWLFQMKHLLTGGEVHFKMLPDEKEFSPDEVGKESEVERDSRKLHQTLNCSNMFQVILWQIRGKYLSVAVTKRKAIGCCWADSRRKVTRVAWNWTVHCVARYLFLCVSTKFDSTFCDLRIISGRTVITRTIRARPTWARMFWRFLQGKETRACLCCCTFLMYGVPPQWHGFDAQQFPLSFPRISYHQGSAFLTEFFRSRDKATSVMCGASVIALCSLQSDCTAISATRVWNPGIICALDAECACLWCQIGRITEPEVCTASLETSFFWAKNGASCSSWNSENLWWKMHFGVKLLPCHLSCNSADVLSTTGK